MNVIKVTTINNDGSVAFEGTLGPNEVRFFLDTGINFLLQQGTLAMMDEAEDDDDDDELIEMEGPGTVQ